MNEHDFVSFLEKNFSFRHGKGIGDDASVVKNGDHYQLITTDILIENVHFRRDYFSLKELALKSIAVNLSDIAAMGGQGEYFYLGLGFPGKIDKKQLFDFFGGIREGCRRWQVELAGGDFSASPTLFISITMVGRAYSPIYRSGALENDLIGISGLTGESAVGLKLLERGIDSGPFVAKHKIVNPELEKGPALARYVNAMTDVSDGLLIDLNRILTASKKSANLYYEKIPVTGQMRQVCIQQGFDEYEMVLAGGEDYVLLFTLSPQKEKELRQSLENFDYHIIGEVTGRGKKITIKHHGKLLEPGGAGYDHFSKMRQAAQNK